MYTISQLKNSKGLFHVFSTVEDGNMSLVINQEKVEPNQVVENRKRFFKRIGVDIDRGMTVWLQHDTKVVEAKEKWLGKTILNQIDPPKADAVITNKLNIYLALTIADCVPVIIYDPKVKAVGLIHAGWKGVDEKIVVKTVKKMVEKYHSDPKDLVIGIGPCIGSDSYIKDDFPEGKKNSWGSYVVDMGRDKYSIDLVGYIKEQLFSSGVEKSNIHTSSVDVYKNDRFYSHYRDIRTKSGDRGRFLCVVGISG